MANYFAYLHRGQARVHSRDDRGALRTGPLIGRSATENPHMYALAKMVCLLLIALVGAAAARLSIHPARGFQVNARPLPVCL
jgi:hypothetical protein